MKKFEETMSSIYHKANVKKAKMKRQRKVFISSVLSLCLLTVIVVGAFNTMDTPINTVPPENTDTQVDTVPPENLDTSLRGLVVDNFKLSDIQTGMMADRLGVMKLSDFFGNSPPDIFVFVRVIDTKQYEDKSEDYLPLKQKQTSSVQVIDKLWTNNIDIPKTLTIIQYLYGGCIDNEKTNLLRKDGVYLLPLKRDETEGKWYVWYDLDVLFEVDDKGKVWSHSDFEKLNYFDGKDTSVLSDMITQMTSDKNFSSAISPLGQMIRSWGDIGVLAEVKVSSAETEKNQWGDENWKYSFNEFKPLFNTTKKNIGAYEFAGNKAALKVGSKYLLMLDYSENGPYIESSRAAKLNENGTISPVDSDGFNIFEEFDGYNINEIKAVVEKAQLWAKEFGEK